MKHLKILSHPIFTSLSFHMPMVVDLSHPLIMLEGENGSGKSTLLHSIYHALKGEQIDGYVYKLDEEPEMKEFVETASHGQVMLSLFQQTFPGLAEGTILLLDEPEMALSQSNQRRIVKMLKELVDQRNFRIIAATHSPHLLASPETYVINLDRHVNRNVLRDDFGIEGASTIH
jgi:predicted ATPase